MDTIDLDALLPPSTTIKFKDKTIEVKPPNTADVLRIGMLGQKLKDANDLSNDDLDKAIKDLTDVIYRCIPELDGEALGSAQLLMLTKIIGDMATPPDSKELDARGISVDNGPKAQ